MGEPPQHVPHDFQFLSHFFGGAYMCRSSLNPMKDEGGPTMKRVAFMSGKDRQSGESRMALSAPPVEGPLEAPACGLSARSTARRAVSSKPMSRATSPSRRPRTGRILIVNIDTHNRLQL